MNEKMTDETVRILTLRHTMNQAWTHEEQESVLAHIAALTAERDEALGAVVSEADALLGRVQALEADLEDKRALANKWMRSAQGLHGSLAATRQRAGDARRMAETLPPEKMGLVQRAIDRIVGDDAPGPMTDEEARRLCKAVGIDTAAGLAKCMEMVRAAQRPNASDLSPQAETGVEPTTAEAFATVRDMSKEHVDDDEARCLIQGNLSLLERRMGALAGALAYMAEVVEEVRDGKRALTDLVTLPAHVALTDAPPVFTLAEVEAAMTGIYGPAPVLERLRALRKTSP